MSSSFLDRNNNHASHVPHDGHHALKVPRLWMVESPPWPTSTVSHCKDLSTSFYLYLHLTTIVLEAGCKNLWVLENRSNVAFKNLIDYFIYGHPKLKLYFFVRRCVIHKQAKTFTMCNLCFLFFKQNKNSQYQITLSFFFHFKFWQLNLQDKHLTSNIDQLGN